MSGRNVQINGSGNVIGSLNTGSISGNLQSQAYQGGSDAEGIGKDAFDDLLEIQSLLKQLDASNPQATLQQKDQFVQAAIPVGKRKRLISALQGGGRTALKKFLDNGLSWDRVESCIVVYPFE